MCLLPTMCVLRHVHVFLNTRLIRSMAILLVFFDAHSCVFVCSAEMDFVDMVADDNEAEQVARALEISEIESMAHEVMLSVLIFS